MNESVDAEWSVAGDEDLVRRHRELEAAFDHAVRRQRAYDYLSRVEARIRRRVWRAVTATAAALALAIAMALLVG